MKALLILPLFSSLVVSQAMAQDAAGAKTPAPAWTSTDAYPLDTCVVSGRPFASENMQVVELDGRKFKLCSAECEVKLRKDPQGYAAKLDRAAIDAQLADYPLSRCPISGKELGAMGDPAEIVLDDHLVQLCCGGCTKKARAKKDEIVRDIQAAAYAKQKDTYPLKKCLNSGEELDPDTMVEVMHGSTLLRFCCEDCIDELNKAPTKMLAKLVKARKEAGSDQRSSGDGAEHEGHGKQEESSQHKDHKADHGSGRDGQGKEGQGDRAPATSGAKGGCCGGKPGGCGG